MSNWSGMVGYRGFLEMPPYTPVHTRFTHMGAWKVGTDTTHTIHGGSYRQGETSLSMKVIWQ